MRTITFALLTLLFCSCKEYNCKCTTTNGYTAGSSTSTYKASSKKKAEATCEESEAHMKTTDSLVSCTLL